MRLSHPILACLLLVPTGCLLSENAAPGFVEGHVRILASKDVELAEGNPPKFSVEDYAEYPLMILSRDTRQEVARITADRDGNYHIALPPGDYVLDVQGRVRGHLRAKPQPFKIISNQTVHVDMDSDTGIR